MQKFINILIAITLIGCKSKPSENFTGEYLGFWAETIWIISLETDNSFKITSDGHFGNSITSGKYILQNDTLIFLLDISSSIAKYTDHENFIITDNCLIDLESRYDYCKIRPDEWTSEKRNIYYPQIPYDSNINKQIVNQMLQEVLDQIDTKTLSDSTLYLKEYYEINSSNNYELNRFGKRVHILSEIELMRRGITNYLAIEDFTLGQQSSFIILNVEPYIETFNSTIVTFKKNNSKWRMENNGR